MRPSVMRRHDLQVLDLASTIALLDLEPHVRELDVAVLAGKAVLAGPRLHVLA